MSFRTVVITKRCKLDYKMNFLFNSISELLIGIAQEAATYCMFIFFEPEIPKSLREE